MGRILGSWGAKSYILLRCVGLSHQPPSLVFTQPNKYLNRPVIPNANWSSSLRVTICCRLFSSSFFYLSGFCFASTARGIQVFGGSKCFLGDFNSIFRFLLWNSTLQTKLNFFFENFLRFLGETSLLSRVWAAPWQSPLNITISSVILPYWYPYYLWCIF